MHRRHISHNDLVPIPDMSTWHFAFKTNAPPSFHEVKVRATHAHAIDMTAVVEVLCHVGFSTKTMNLTGTSVESRFTPQNAGLIAARFRQTGA